MIRPTFFLGFVLLGVVAFVLFEVEYRVDSMKSQFSEVNRQLTADKEAIHVLKAEWSYLNQPERLRKLSQRYLALENVSSRQLKDIDQIPLINANYAENRNITESKQALLEQ